MPKGSPHVQKITVISQTLPVEDKSSKTTGAQKDITLDPCGGIRITVSLDRPNEEVTLSAEDVRDDNASFVYKEGGGSYDSTQTYGPYPEGDQIFFVKEQNKDCVFKLVKEVIHCDISLSIDKENEQYGKSNGSIEATVSTPSDSVEWAFDGGAWYSGGKTQEWDGLSEGVYLVEVRDEWGCKTDVMVNIENNTDDNPPSIPENLTIQDRSDGEATVLDWDESTDDETSVDFYRVYRGTTENFTADSNSRIAEVSNTSYEDEGVVHDTTYYYKVSAVDDRNNESSTSTEKEYLFTDEVIPQAPSSLSGNTSDNTVSLDWDASASPDVDHYNIYMDDGTDFSVEKSVSGGTTSTDVTGLTNQKDYDFKVTTVDEAGNESSASNTITKTPKDVTPPASPTNLSGEYDPDVQEVQMNWDDNTETDLEGYNVYRSTQSGGPYNQIGTNIQSSSYNDSISDSNEGTIYYYVVTAVDDDSNESSNSNEIKVDTTPQIWILPSSEQQITLTIDSTNIDQDVSEFPMYVDLSDLPSSIFTDTKDNGGDIRVVDESGNFLPREVNIVDNANEEGFLYTLVPNVSSSSDTKIRIRYDVDRGEPDLKGPEGRYAVWNNYTHVYHFAPNAPTKNSAQDRFHLNDNGTSETQDGIIGEAARSFDGSSSYMDISISPNQLSRITVESWFKLDPNVGENANDIINWGDGFDNYLTSRIRTFSDAEETWFHIENRNNDGSAAVEGDTIGGSMAWNTDQWYHYAGTYNGKSSVSKVFNDGSKQAENTNLPQLSAPTSNNFTIGKNSFADDRYFHGNLDELRVGKYFEASEEYIRISEINQRNPTSFYTVSSTGTVNEEEWDYRQKVTLNSSKIPSDQSSFPVRVELSDFTEGIGWHKNEISDIRVTKKDKQTTVPVDDRWYNPESGEGVVYFLADNLSSTEDQVFYIYYGNSSVQHTNGSDVWRSETVGKWNVSDLVERNKIPDASGNFNHGVLFGRRFGPRLQLPGGDDSAWAAIDTFSYNSALIPEKTVTCWFKADKTSGIIASFDRNEYWRLELGGSAAANSNEVGMSFHAGGTTYDDFEGGKDVVDNQWHHVAFVFDNGTAYIYVDGDLEEERSVSSQTLGSGNSRYGFLGIGSEADVFDGSRGPTGQFNGDLSEFRIWEKALSQEEIRDNMEGSLRGDEDGLVLYFPLDENEGDPKDKVLGANAVISGNIGWDNQQFNAPLEFGEDNDQHIKIYNEGFPNGDPDLTLSALARAATTSISDWVGIFATASGVDTDQVLTVNYDGGEQDMTLHTYGNSTAPFALDTNEHHYVATTKNGGDQTFIVDGSEIGTLSRTLNIPSGAWIIGNRPGSLSESNSGRFWPGYVSDYIAEDVVRGTDRITTQANNYGDPSTFYSVQDEERRIGVIDVPHIDVTQQNGDKIALDISKHSGVSADKFHLYRADNSGGSFSLIKTIDNPASTESYDDTNVTEGEDYYYKATIELGGTEGNFSDETLGEAKPYVFEKVYFSKSGVNDDVFVSSLDSYNDSLFGSFGSDDSIRNVRVDRKNEFVFANGEYWPSISKAPFGGSFEGDMTGGDWHDGFDIDVDNQEFYNNNSYEQVDYRDYGGNVLSTLDLWGRDERPTNHLCVDVPSDRMVLATGGSYNGFWSISLSNPGSDQTELTNDVRVKVFCLDRDDDTIYYRDPNDSTKIRRMNYDGTSDEEFKVLSETIHHMVSRREENEAIWYCTSTAIYRLNLGTKSANEVLTHPDEIRQFDLR